MYIVNKSQRIIFHMESENLIFEIYTPENPMSTVESKSLAYFCNLFTLRIYCKQK